jgi:hypothetical protein
MRAVTGFSPGSASLSSEFARVLMLPLRFGSGCAMAMPSALTAKA